MLVLAVGLLSTAVVLLGLALRQVMRTPVAPEVDGPVRAARDAAADLDAATDEFRAAVDDRTGR